MNMQHSEARLRTTLLDTCLALNALHLNKGSSGNVSARFDEGFMITPSGVPAHQMTIESMVKMKFDGSFETHQTPSSEWRFHLDILRTRPEVNAVIHTHSTYATALSTLRRDVPAFHYMVAVAGGNSIRCTPYNLFGTQQLSNNVLSALQDRKACLMANHGMIAVGSSLEKAMNIAVEVENLCQQYLIALSVGEPVILSNQEMNAVHHQFIGYGNFQ